MKVTKFATDHVKTGEQGEIVDLYELLNNANNQKGIISIQPFYTGVRITTQNENLLNGTTFDNLFVIDIDAVGGIEKITNNNGDRVYTPEAKQMNYANSIKIINGMKSDEYNFMFTNVVYANLSRNNNLHLFCCIPNFDGNDDFVSRYKSASEVIAEMITTRINECNFVENNITADPAMERVHQLCYVAPSNVYVITNENDASPIDEDLLYSKCYEPRLKYSCQTEISCDAIIGDGEDLTFVLSSDNKIKGYPYTGHNARWRIANMVFMLLKKDYNATLDFLKRHFPSRIKELTSVLNTTYHKSEIRLDEVTLNWLIKTFKEFDGYKEWFASYKKNVKIEQIELNKQLAHNDNTNLIGLSKDYDETSTEYVSDIITHFISKNKNCNIQLIAKCGMGKTYAIKNELMKSNNVLIVNFLNSLNLAGYKDVYKSGQRNASMLTGNESAAINVANFEFVSNDALDNFNYIVIDEIQKFFQDDDYRNMYSINRIRIENLLKQNKVILLTGTPWLMDKLGKFKTLLINKKYDYIKC